MSYKPLISIIMNCYNGEKYLSQALKSVLNQTYNNWELIFWDNQSTDKSAKIFKEYQDVRFKYFYASSHTFLYEARNEAVKKTKGEFIAILDVDDWWIPEKLEMQLSLFKDDEVGLVYGNVWVFEEKEKKKKIFSKKKLPTGKILGNIFSNYMIALGTIVIRRKYLESLKYAFDKRFHIIGDFDLNIRMAEICKFDCVQKPISYFRVHDKNESYLNKDKEIHELKILYSEMKNNPVFSAIDTLKQIPLKISYLEIMQAILKDGFRKSFLQVIKYPFCFNKIKLITALLLPKFVLKNLKYWVV